ncbi:hypothetical protein BZG36_05149 [Bifiguratus adelaidae]|uniref:Zn(2)-C6 fungal-type domain-containing protein n=1 Tax=Bifiguratus adelaidae TaxID=1938954 RepID=A0A261XU39_9FUNG|nr:hypothetical protein BZG36_05149 [Bifiguratus adelaidae]
MSISPDVHDLVKDIQSGSYQNRPSASKAYNVKPDNNPSLDYPASSSQSDHSNTENSKRKKASRACYHCQKAHLTCDDSRPCQRCIKRDLASTCRDGIRKKAKYLRDIDEESQILQTPHQLTATPPQVNDLSELTSLANLTQSSATDLTPSTDTNNPYPFAMTSQPFDTSTLFGFPIVDHGFGSEAVNLEYSILSDMLQSPQFDASTPPTSSATPTQQFNNMPSVLNYDTMWNASSDNAEAKGSGDEANQSDSAKTSAESPSKTGQSNQMKQSQTPPSTQTTIPPLVNMHAPQKRESLNGSGQPSTPGITATVLPRRKTNSVSTPQAAYSSVQRPFNYAEGYHYLIRYVRDRMSREDLMRISRALALFRPSHLALIMNLTEEDLIFMEKCFQRTLLEYEKLISFSGTPIVVWRRTGEIALVGKEFSLLTQWSKDSLLGKKTYIYELMDNQSAVEYWEKFSTHAFDNTESAVMTICILLTPTNRPVPCTFCFTIKRDIFDLPSVIVGNFLPILS